MPNDKTASFAVPVFQSLGLFCPLVFSTAVTDIRQRAVMHTFNGHNSRIRSLAIDYKNGLLLSGSVDGDLKVCLCCISYRQVNFISHLTCVLKFSDLGS